MKWERPRGLVTETPLLALLSKAASTGPAAQPVLPWLLQTGGAPWRKGQGAGASCTRKHEASEDTLDHSPRTALGGSQRPRHNTGAQRSICCGWESIRSGTHEPIMLETGHLPILCCD